MNEMKVTLELCTEDRARLDRILAALENIGTPVTTEPAPVVEVEKTTQKAPEAEPQVNTQPEPEAPKAEPKPAPTVTKDEIRTKVVALVNAKKKDQVMAIIKAHAASVTDLPEDKLDEVMQKLTELEKEVTE